MRKLFTILFMLPLVAIAQEDFRELWPNGTVKEEGKLVADSLKQGVWKSFYDDGKPFLRASTKTTRK